MSLIKKSIFILNLFISINFFAQEKVIDSLKNELLIHKQKDTVRVNTLNRLAFSFFSRDILISLEYLDEVDVIAEVIDFKKGKARSIYIRGITEAIQSNYKQALLYYNEALKLYENIGFKKGSANCYNAMGITYKNKGELRKSISYLKKATKIEEEIGSNNLSASLINLGAAYQELGEFSEAILYLKKALSIAKTDGNEQRVAYSLNNIGTVYINQGNYRLALEHFKESLYINEKLGDSISIAHNLSNIGSIYETQKYNDKAMKYYERSLDIYERINSKKGISRLLNVIGIIHQKNGDNKSALENYVNALRLSKQIGAKSDIPHILNNIGDVYLVLKNYSTANKYFTEAKKNATEIENKGALCYAYYGLSRTYTNQKEYNNALINAIKAQKISIKFGFVEHQKEAYETLYKIYKAKNNYKKALTSYEEFKKLNDSLFNKETIGKIAQLESEYKYYQELDAGKIRELQLTNTVKTTEKNLEKSQQNLLTGVIVFLLLILILGIIIFVLKYRNIKSKTQNIVIEQKLLRSQMTPHFIFNSLAVLQGMILNKEEENSISYLSKFSKLLRTVLENSRHKRVLLADELKAIESFMELQNLDVNPPFKYKIIIDSKIKKTALKIPPMLIQPFIENAIEHAFPNKKNDKEIIVELNFKDEMLLCTIEDNGIGVNIGEQKTKKNKKSLATTITSERLKMLSKDFNVKGSLTVKNRKLYGEQGTLVTLEIPYKKDVA